MREVAFIKQNKQKWLEFEQAIFGKSKKNPDEMATLYIHLVNDLSFARTYYPKSKTVVYLNHLAASIYQKIYKTKRQETNRVVSFFLQQVPLLVYRYRRYLLYAFLLFACFLGIGIISAKYDDAFVRLIMGDAYVNTTLENIKKGDPLGIYASGSTWGSFISITFNNLYVGMKCYVFGIFAGLGTFYMLLQNSVMLGSFEYFFYQHGLLGQSLLTIWIHGSMEIFAMVVESACGFILAASLFFPKTYSRMESLKIGFRDSFYLFLATVPFTFAAGVLEGFVTRYADEMPAWVNLLIIFSTLSLISYYFLVYPFIVHKKFEKAAGPSFA